VLVTMRMAQRWAQMPLCQSAISRVWFVSSMIKMKLSRSHFHVMLGSSALFKTSASHAF